MNDHPLVSVVIPTYNRKNKLIRLIDSILQSDYPKEKLEIIVVDDASTDGTYEEIKKRFPWVKYVRHKNETLIAKSRNDGILVASSELIFFVDDDNVIDRNCIKTLVNVMLEHPDIGVAGPVTYYLEKPDIIQYAGAIYAKFTRTTKFLFHKMKDNGFLKGKIIDVDGIANSFMLRKSLAIRAGLIPWKRIPWNGEDGYLQYKIKKLGYRVVIIGDAKTYHDIPIDSKSKYNPMRIYYALRSKIIFHKDLDEKIQFLSFIISLPIYIIWYLYIAICSKEKIKCIKASIEGFIDGLLGKKGIKYV
ncbi:MAG: glycosyltransferase family 2 protein [Thermoprotei archaeon]|nr:MAG: glycosyltransferase family 2 protein [Thermoprotei archaeon]